MRLSLALILAATGLTACSPPERPAATVSAPRISLPARVLLRASRGEHRRPLPRVARHHRAVLARGDGRLDWRALAYCEATGNPRAVDPSGTYFGLYQFDLGTWRSVGGQGNPADASPAEQTYRAQLLYAQRGRSPWPVCGARL